MLPISLPRLLVTCTPGTHGETPITTSRETRDPPLMERLKEFQGQVRPTACCHHSIHSLFILLLRWSCHPTQVIKRKEFCALSGCEVMHDQSCQMPCMVPDGTFHCVPRFAKSFCIAT